jgi:predicted nucleic acid-binding protein
MSPLGVVLDACVLFPFALCDTLLRAAEAGLYRLFWSDAILDELRRNLVDRGITSAGQAQHRVREMRRAFPDALVEGYEFLVDDMPNHPKDRHVLAVAVRSGAQIVVTENLKDFPKAALDPFHVEARSADAFLCDLLDLNRASPVKLAEILRQQAADLKHPPVAVDDLLEGLSKLVPRFSASFRRVLASQQEIQGRGG